ncbi:unnamed protein product [Urochloa decumbens]|uniref:RING-type domain-containing protein n=1 Tax=Urochloa decumbens TaxID=240449 RepID=A0ABC8YM95_9POAL
MSAELAIKIAAVARVAALIVAVIAAAASAWARARDGTGRGTTAQDAERALGLGAATVMTYELAAAGMAGAPPTAPEVRADRCAICLWEYAGRGGELVRVVPACGHFFHADGCLRKRGTCPLCRGGLWALAAAGVPAHATHQRRGIAICV